MAKTIIGRMYNITSPCECSEKQVDLWTDSGTNDFFLNCSNPKCEFGGPNVDLDSGESILDLIDTWNQGFVNPHEAEIRLDGSCDLYCAKCHYEWRIPSSEKIKTRDQKHLECPKCKHRTKVLILT